MLSWSLGRNGASTRFLLGFLSPCRTARRSRQRFCAFLARSVSFAAPLCYTIPTH